MPFSLHNKKKANQENLNKTERKVPVKDIPKKIHKISFKHKKTSDHDTKMFFKFSTKFYNRFFNAFSYFTCKKKFFEDDEMFSLFKFWYILLLFSLNGDARWFG